MHEQSETVQRGDGRWVNVYGSKTPNAGKELPGSGDFATVAEAVTSAKARSAAHGSGDGGAAVKNIRFEGKVHQFPDDATDAEIASVLEGKPAAISGEDRRAYTEALPGTPEGMKVREGIEGKYGGREAFVKEYDPTGEALGKSIPAMALIGAGAGAPAAVGGAATALGSPALRAVAAEVIKWLGRGALGAGGFEAARRIAGQK